MTLKVICQILFLNLVENKLIVQQFESQFFLWAPLYTFYAEIVQLKYFLIFSLKNVVAIIFEVLIWIVLHNICQYIEHIMFFIFSISINISEDSIVAAIEIQDRTNKLFG
eukprot:TRINITY_DN2981_c1_g2_i3.p3 TRINITY_DN2981_c1_g2~~TRINITY_DN2981_c1_g2_i3.p3  ORF type:complete len:110 (+),score=0.75 TRINITY_DN2981_c1_g2_i3:123-452(+)